MNTAGLKQSFSSRNRFLSFCSFGWVWSKSTGKFRSKFRIYWGGDSCWVK
jgi:hypothetical protein